MDPLDNAVVWDCLSKDIELITKLMLLLLSTGLSATCVGTFGLLFWSQVYFRARFTLGVRADFQPESNIHLGAKVEISPPRALHYESRLN